MIMTLLTWQIFSNSVKLPRILLILKRFKSKQKLKLKKISPCINALNHFDYFYKGIFKDRWPSVRLGLLSKQKYFAVINNFGDVEKTEKFLQEQGALNVRSFLEIQKNFVQQSDVGNSLHENIIDLDKIISEELLQEEEKESQLHPEGMEFKARADVFNQQINDSKNNEDYMYNPEDDWRSLDASLSDAEIDKSRMIMPDSGMESTNLFHFVPATKLRNLENYIPESEYYKYYKVKSKYSVDIEEELELDFPENLKVYTFDRGDITDFPEPENLNGVYNFLKLDGGDLLTALALGVQPSDRVLDMCSSSGNIAFCIFQILRAKFIICSNDRKRMTKDLFNQYLQDDLFWDKLLFITSESVDEIKYEGLFDKVLIDVCSTFDRKSLYEAEENIFHASRKKERLLLPERQCSQLVKGLRLTRPGGTLIYTTSTLSPVQNDGVVNQALRILWEENKMKCTVKNLSPALKHTSVLFNFGDFLNLKFGTLIVPFVPVNFGPRYICKIVKGESQREEKVTNEAD